MRRTQPTHLRCRQTDTNSRAMRIWRTYLAALALLLGMGALGIAVMTIWPGALIASALVPRAAFVAPPPLTAADYAGETRWFARPRLSRAADPVRSIPRDWHEPPAQRPRAAVFLVLGTTSFDSDHWNDQIERRDATARDALALRLNASAFNRSDIWAPIYRQAVRGAFLGPPAQGRAAIDVAYADVRAAFDAFVAELPADRPIVLVGHDQGALLVLRLLRDRVAHRPLATRMVAVYAIGWPVMRERLEARLGVSPCTSPDQAGCLMSWNSFARPADPDDVRAMLARLPFDPALPERPPFVCTNPLTGGGAPAAPAGANLGTLVPDASGGAGAIRVATIAARCVPQGWLMVDTPPWPGNFVERGNDYGAYDITLFWANVRADVARRETAWYARQHG